MPLGLRRPIPRGDCGTQQNNETAKAVAVSARMAASGLEEGQGGRAEAKGHGAATPG